MSWFKGKRRRCFIVSIGTATIVLVGTMALYLRNHHHDPKGISRRPPYSMHAHQGEWVVKSRFPLSPLQSPVPLNTTKLAELTDVPIEVQIHDSKAELLDVGHTFQIRYSSSSPGASARFEGKKFELRQFHFHKPSEHLIDGRQYEMEAHFVFMNKDKSASQKALVLGVMILDGAHNPELAKIWKHLPPYREGYGESKVEISDWEEAASSHELDVDTHAHVEKTLASDIEFALSGLLPVSSDFIIYDGSLTTPNCDEGITHAVALSPIYLEHEQVEHFEGYYEGNNRDPQSLGDISKRNFRRASVVFK
ncbi:MAG: carbonic anhydrase family protein [Cyanobacteria bacterium]|nr:carbonic anhydrase family protein [Cyanobacteriota bacterium]